MNRKRDYLYKQIIEYILAEVRDEKLLPGAKVPTESQLSEMFSVSRITSKKALDELAASGVITRTPGRGSHVAATVKKKVILEPPLAPGRQRRLVGVVMPDLGDRYSCNLLRELERAAGEAGVLLLFKRSLSSQDEEERAVDECLAAGVDALVIFPAFGKFFNARLLRLILDGFPVTVVDREMAGVPTDFVGTDNYLAARQLVERFSPEEANGVLVISPPVTNNTSLERRVNGIVEGLAARGVVADIDNWYMQAHTELTGMDDISLAVDDIAMLDKWLGKRKPACIVALESKYAAMALCAYRGANVYSFDNPGVLFCEKFAGFVCQDAKTIAARVVGSLLRQLEGCTDKKRCLVAANFVRSRNWC